MGNFLPEPLEAAAASSVVEDMDARSSCRACSGKESISRGLGVHVGVLCSRNKTLQQIWDLLYVCTSLPRQTHQG